MYLTGKCRVHKFCGNERSRHKGKCMGFYELHDNCNTQRKIEVHFQLSSDLFIALSRLDELFACADFCAALTLVVEGLTTPGCCQESELGDFDDSQRTKTRTLHANQTFLLPTASPLLSSSSSLELELCALLELLPLSNELSVSNPMLAATA